MIKDKKIGVNILISFLDFKRRRIRVIEDKSRRGGDRLYVKGKPSGKPSIAPDDP